MITRLVCLMVVGWMCAQEARANGELNAQVLCDLAFGSGNEDRRRVVVEGGEGEIENFTPWLVVKHKVQKVRGRLILSETTLGLAMEIQLQRYAHEIKIAWSGMHDTANGEFGVGHRLPVGVHGGNWATFAGATPLRWTEDGKGIELEERHFPVADGPGGRLSIVEKVEVVIRPGKIRIFIKSRTGRRAEGPTEQKFTIEFDR